MNLEEKLENKNEKIESEISQLNMQLSRLSIDSIPPEVLTLIFAELDTSDKLRCRSVCRHWNAIVLSLPGSENLLVVDELVDEEFCHDLRWFESNKAFDHGVNRICLSKLNFEMTETSPFLLNLRRLRVDGVKEPESGYKLIVQFINRLVGLEELEIFELRLNEKATIDLPKLRALSLSQSVFKIELNTPLLQKFRGRYDGMIASPEHLNELWLCKSSFKIRRYKNVEVLKISDDLIEPSILSELPKLSELWCQCVGRPGSEGDFKKQKERILEILEEKRKLAKDNLKIVFYNIHLENPSQLDGFELDDKKQSFDLIRLQMQNYDKLLGDLSNVKSVDFADLMDCTNDSLPADFFKRFTHIEAIYVTRWLATQERVMKLLGFCALAHRLVQLHFQDSLFSSPFFDALATLFPRIQLLSIAEAHQFPSFDFILKFKNLRHLAIFCQDLRADLIKQVFEQFEGGFDFLDATEQNTLGMEKKWSKKRSAYKYVLTAYTEEDDDYREKFNNLEEMMEEVRKFKKEA